MNEQCECPLCSALIDTSELELYQMITCHECGEDLEYIGEELIFTD